VLAVDNVTKRYGTVVALDGVSLGVARGEVLGFLGPNGAGKTTTMRAILGLVALDGGEITWDGRPIDDATRSRIGYMPAERGMYPTMRVRDHVIYFARLAGLGREDAGAAADRWLERLDLTDRASSKVQDLSSGNQQRVQLALALAHDPQLLVLDEPFSGLDPLAVDVVKEVVGEQVSAGAALLFSSHQLDLVEDLAPEVAIIDRGRIVMQGDVQDLRAASAVREVDVVFERPPPESWTCPYDVLRQDDRRLRVRVDASTEPRDALERLGTGGAITSFEFAPPPLSSVFVEAVRR